MNPKVTREWLQTQSRDLLDAAIMGDPVFKIAEKASLQLEQKWKPLARSWSPLIDKSVKSGLFGWGGDIVDRRWLAKKLFGLPKFWPKGLTEKEKAILKVMRAMVPYHPAHEQGIFVDSRSGITQEPERIESEEATLKAMRAYAKNYEKKVLLPMWDALDEVLENFASAAEEACNQVYKTPCDFKSAKRMLYGDLLRGWRLETLPFTTTSYRTFGAFLEYTDIVKR